jgi:rhodanese-related sulfurtransferase
MEDITVEELKSKLDNKEDFLLIDVREQNEYDMFNLKAQLIPLADLPGKLQDLEDYKDKEIVVHCRSGARSATAKAFLEQAGFTKVRNLLGGVLAWIDKYQSA